MNVGIQDGLILREGIFLGTKVKLVFIQRRLENAWVMLCVGSRLEEKEYRVLLKQERKFVNLLSREIWIDLNIMVTFIKIIYGVNYEGWFTKETIGDVVNVAVLLIRIVHLTHTILISTLPIMICLILLLFVKSVMEKLVTKSLIG